MRNCRFLKFSGDNDLREKKVGKSSYLRWKRWRLRFSPSIALLLRQSFLGTTSFSYLICWKKELCLKKLWCSRYSISRRYFLTDFFIDSTRKFRIFSKVLFYVKIENVSRKLLLTLWLVFDLFDLGWLVLIQSYSRKLSLPNLESKKSTDDLIGLDFNQNLWFKKNVFLFFKDCDNSKRENLRIAEEKLHLVW